MVHQRFDGYGSHLPVLETISRAEKAGFRSPNFPVGVGSTLKPSKEKKV